MSSIITPFVLSGGSGTRLWPLSRQAYPKQFLSLAGEGSLLQQSCQRLAGDRFATPVILGNNRHRFIIAEQLQEIGMDSADIILEPVGRNTAPAALVAALACAAQQGKDALVLLMPSDHAIEDNEGFRRSVLKGTEAAGQGSIVTFGIHPHSPETGYGYIETSRQDDTNETDDIRDVLRFVEKPSRQKAEEYLTADNFLWNAGIFLYAAKTMIAAFETHAPQILACAREAFEAAKKDLDFLRLDKAAYNRCESISLDYAIMEKMSGIKCVPLATDWSDLGAWPALWDLKEKQKDKNGNVTSGDILLHQTSNSYVHSIDGICLSMIGMDDVIAVATRDAVLLAPKNQAQEVGKLVDKLKDTNREEHIFHTRVYRPWGWYESLGEGERFQVKYLFVKPGAQLSLQSHHHRAEHWVVVSGTAEVTVGEKTFLLTENESTYIPIGTRHRLGNPGKVPALLVEVQSGTYLGEDDIIRHQDDFNRSTDDAG